jgi:hypothetical protein
VKLPEGTQARLLCIRDFTLDEGRHKHKSDRIGDRICYADVFRRLQHSP